MWFLIALVYLGIGVIVILAQDIFDKAIQGRSILPTTKSGLLVLLIFWPLVTWLRYEEALSHEINRSSTDNYPRI